MSKLIGGESNLDYPFNCISEFIFVETVVEKSDIILIPGASCPQLMERAVELYNRGLAKYILPSGGANSKLTYLLYVNLFWLDLFKLKQVKIS